MGRETGDENVKTGGGDGEEDGRKTEEEENMQPLTVDFGRANKIQTRQNK